MNNVTWVGVVYIWIGFLWPILVTATFLLAVGNKIQEKGKFFVFSIFLGYLALIIGNYFFSIAILQIYNPAEVKGDEVNEAIFKSVVGIFSVIFLFVPSIAVNYFMYRRAVSNALKSGVSQSGELN